MSATTVALSPTGPKSHRLPARVVALPGLAATVDHLAELRGLIRRAQDEERKLTAEILGFMESAGLKQLAGAEAVAIRDERTTMKVDVGLFVEATGRAGFDALTVSVTAARKHLGERDLAAISESTTAPALRVVPIGDGKAAA